MFREMLLRFEYDKLGWTWAIIAMYCHGKYIGQQRTLFN